MSVQDIEQRLRYIRGGRLPGTDPSHSFRPFLGSERLALQIHAVSASHECNPRCDPDITERDVSTAHCVLHA
eukprot:3718173-Rhodomonas_salina.2